jgi:hypothetical protein
MKDGFDGAEIAGNSVAAYVVQLLGALLGRRDWLENAERTFGYYGSRLAGNAVAMPRMLVAMDLAVEPPRHVVVAGKPGAEDRALVQGSTAASSTRPFAGGGRWERNRRLANPCRCRLTPVWARHNVCVDTLPRGGGRARVRARATGAQAIGGMMTGSNAGRRTWLMLAFTLVWPLIAPAQMTGASRRPRQGARQGGAAP